jgi:enamine deaminase RidA (YjgF/YER057c/UK114 family)
MTTRRTVFTLVPPPQYAHAAVLDPGERLVVTAGAVPVDREGNLIGAGSVPEQTEAVIANLEAALRSVGSSLERVIQTRVYVVAEKRSDLVAAWEIVRGSSLSAGPHCSTLLGVAMLGYTGQLVEIEALAVVSEVA